jgi:hypothetical protein
LAPEKRKPVRDRFEGMAEEGSVLAQEDIDALLTKANKAEGIDALSQEDIDSLFDHSDEDRRSLDPDEQPFIRTERKPRERSDKEIQDMLVQLQDRACLKRDKGIKVIWNAASSLPMVEGLTMKIKGVDYVSLGVLNKNHLIVGYKQ